MEERTRIKHEVFGAALEALGTLPPGDVSRTQARFEMAIAGRVFPFLASGNEVSRGVYSAGTLRGWIGSSVIAAAALAAFAIRYVPANSPRAESKTYSTAPTQRANITLADGSNVILAPATTLRVSGRNVELQGEAVFNVANHEGAAFTVRSGNATTRVLGTTFAIRAYDEKVRIAVAEGKVNTNSVILSAGDVATVTTIGTQLEREANIGNMFAWTSGKLVFRLTPFRDVIPDLERWYGIKVLASNNLLEHTVTMTLDNETSSEVVELLESALQAKAIRNGNVITIKR